MTDLLNGSHTVIVLGSGGVGKTTMSAALALKAAMEGRRALCLTIDPAKRLANSLGLAELPSEPHRIPPSLFEMHGLKCTGELYAVVLDKKRTFDDLVRSYTSDRERLEGLLNNRLYRYVSTSLAGTHEYMAMEKLHSLQLTNEFDVIIVDTPPASDVFGFLDAPDTLVNAIDSPATRWLIRALSDSGNLSLRLVGKGAATLLRGLSRITGAQFMDEVARFVTEFNLLFGGFRQRAEAVRTALADPGVSYVIVATTSPPALAELQSVQRRLNKRQLNAKGIVFNRVQQYPGQADVAAAEHQLRELLGADAATPELQAACTQAYEEEVSRSQNDRRLIDQHTRNEKLRIAAWEIPLLQEDVHDLGGLATLAEHLNHGAEHG